MRISAPLVALLLLLVCGSPALAQEVQKPESTIGLMSFKFVRGLTNVVTAVVELPKQTYLTIRDEGGIGYVIGPMKGVGMTALRAVGGAAEMVFFVVPQPGSYDPILDPDFVWNGWEDHRAASFHEPAAAPQQPPPAEPKGE